MQLFFLSLCPIQAAQMQCDKHVVKMCTETCQIISTVWWKVSRSKYDLYHKLGWLVKPWKVPKHPSIMWVEQSHANYKWAMDHWGALLAEYTKRYGKVHAYQSLYNNMATMAADPSLCRDEFIPMSPQFQAVPEKYKSDDPVVSYRNVYIKEKSSFARWAHGSTPNWFLKKDVNLPN